VNTLEQQLLTDAAVFDTVEPPPGFRAELGQTIRRLPPPAAPPRRGLSSTTVRLALAAAAAIAFLLFVGSLADTNQKDVAVEDGSPTMPVVYNPPQPGPESSAVDDRLVAVESGVPGVTAASVHRAGVARSEFVDAKLEQEWMYIKADAKALSGPFRSAMPSALYRRR